MLYQSKVHPTHKSNSSSSPLRRSRWIVTLVVAALVAAFAGIAPPTPAEAELWWSATLTTGTLSGDAGSPTEGFSNDGVKNYGSLSDDTISRAGVSYTITRLNRADGKLIFDTDPVFPKTLSTFTIVYDVYLVVGPNIYNLNDADLVDTRYTWDPGVTDVQDLFIFEANTDVALISVPSNNDSLTATADTVGRQVTLSWVLFADSSVTKHQYRQKKSSGEYGGWIDIPNSAGQVTNSYTVTGLDAEVEYTFQIQTVNRAGVSGAWNEASATPTAAVPGAPRNVGAAPLDTSVRLTWEAPGSNGGSAITKYQYQQREGSASFGGWADIDDSALSGANAASFTVTGLTNGVAYTFKLRAVNSIGDSAQSG